jgi:hypothetical protein
MIAKMFPLALASLVLSSPLAVADGRVPALYEVRVTNVTSGVYFTPTLAATHVPSVRMFALGAPASSALAALAESGDVSPLQAALDALGREVSATAVAGGLLGPGSSTTFTIRGRPSQDRLSLAAMLLPTNDGFYAIDAVELPSQGIRTYTALGHDAGSEFNDELCSNIPGPQCGGAGLSGEDGEGYVHVHPGTHGMADLSRASYDWRNPVAIVTVTRIQ